jgi:hypothetical protein
MLEAIQINAPSNMVAEQENYDGSSMADFVRIRSIEEQEQSTPTHALRPQAGAIGNQFVLGSGE